MNFVEVDCEVRILDRRAQRDLTGRGGAANAVGQVGVRQVAV